MSSLLDNIVKTKIREIEERKTLYPVKLLEQSVYFASPCVSLATYLNRTDLFGIIAEIKRSSPSAGVMNPYISIEKLSIGYMQAGASALSILTDKEYFNGSLEDLSTARKNNYCPILRKDFVIDEYQIIEAKSYGADVVLLIAKILTPEKTLALSLFAKSLGLEVLLEVHDDKELKAYPNEETKLIGINARNLATLEIDHAFIERAVSDLPQGCIPIAESGIRTPQHVKELAKLGFKGFLIGELFMKTADPAATCKSFIEALRKQ